METSAIIVHKQINLNSSDHRPVFCCSRTHCLWSFTHWNLVVLNATVIERPLLHMFMPWSSLSNILSEIDDDELELTFCSNYCLVGDSPTVPVYQHFLLSAILSVQFVFWEFYQCLFVRIIVRVDTMANSANSSTELCKEFLLCADLQPICRTNKT